MCNFGWMGNSVYVVSHSPSRPDIQKFRLCRISGNRHNIHERRVAGGGILYVQIVCADAKKCILPESFPEQTGKIVRKRKLVNLFFRSQKPIFYAEIKLPNAFWNMNDYISRQENSWKTEISRFRMKLNSGYKTKGYGYAYDHHHIEVSM